MSSAHQRMYFGFVEPDPVLHRCFDVHAMGFKREHPVMPWAKIEPTISIFLCRKI